MFFLENVEYFLILGHFRSNVTVLFPLSVFFDNGMVPYGIEPVIRLIVLNIFISKNRKKWKNNNIILEGFPGDCPYDYFFQDSNFVSSFFFRKMVLSLYFRLQTSPPHDNKNFFIEGIKYINSKISFCNYWAYFNMFLNSLLCIILLYKKAPYLATGIFVLDQFVISIHCERGI